MKKRLLFLLSIELLSLIGNTYSNDKSLLKKTYADNIIFTDSFSLNDCESTIIEQSKFNNLSNSASKIPINYSVEIDGAKWILSTYYFPQTVGYIDCIKTQYSIIHKKGYDCASVDVSNEISYSSDITHSYGGTIKINGNGGSFAGGVIKGISSNFGITIKASIDSQYASGTYDLYLVDKRADAVVKAINGKNCKYLIMKKIPYGRGAEFSIGKPVPSCNKYKSICS